MIKAEIINNVKVNYDADLARGEMIDIVLAEIETLEKIGKELANIELALVGDEIEVKAVEKSPIRRVRRITGYLSQMEKFNDAKADELKERKTHM